jgi:hypothetical protein
MPSGSIDQLAKHTDPSSWEQTLHRFLAVSRSISGRGDKTILFSLTAAAGSSGPPAVLDRIAKPASGKAVAGIAGVLCLNQFVVSCTACEGRRCGSTE